MEGVREGQVCQTGADRQAGRQAGMQGGRLAGGAERVRMRQHPAPAAHV